MTPVMRWGTFPGDGGCRCQYGVQGTSWVSCDRGIQGKGMLQAQDFRWKIQGCTGEQQQDRGEPLPLFALS